MITLGAGLGRMDAFHVTQTTEIEKVKTEESKKGSYVNKQTNNLYGTKINT